MSENEKNEMQRPLTIAMVVDTSGNRGNGTSNSALQWAQELERQGHHVRLVGIGAPEYPARVNHVPLVSWVAKKQQMQFAEPSDTLFRKAFDGVDVVHIYTPFRFGQHACKVAKQMGIAVTAGYHVQPENVTYSAGPLKYVPGIDSFIYWLFDIWLYRKIDHVHVPTELGASLLRSHGYKSKLHVISNGYESRFTPKRQRKADEPSPVPFRIVASGRLTNEKNHVALIRAIARCRHAQDIELVIAGTGPLKKRLQRMAGRLVVSSGFDRIPPECRHAGVAAFRRSAGASVDRRSRIGECHRRHGRRSGAGGRLVVAERGRPVRAAGRIVVPRGRCGRAGPSYRLVDRPSGAARQVGRHLRRTYENQLFGGIVRT